MVFGTLTLRKLNGKWIVIKTGNGIFTLKPLIYKWEAYPEYSGTPWADTTRLSKREKAVAGLHTTLNKLNVFSKFAQGDFEFVHSMSIRRLKRAKWAKYQR